MMEEEVPVIVPVRNLPNNVISNLKWLIPLALHHDKTKVNATEYTEKI